MRQRVVEPTDFGTAAHGPEGDGKTIGDEANETADNIFAAGLYIGQRWHYCAM